MLSWWFSTKPAVFFVGSQWSRDKKLVFYWLPILALDSFIDILLFDSDIFVLFPKPLFPNEDFSCYCFSKLIFIYVWLWHKLCSLKSTKQDCYALLVVRLLVILKIIAILSSIKSSARMETHLNSVRMQNIGSPERIDSGASFLRVHIKPIFRTHLFSIEDTVLFLKSFTFQTHNSSKKLGLCLVSNLVNRVPVHKGSFEWWVPVKIEVK